jgi:hypothetical protein
MSSAAFPDLCRLARTVGTRLVFSLMLVASASPRVWADSSCPIPDTMALHDIALPAARHEVATQQRLTVLTFGGVRPAGPDAPTKGATYPARLQAALTAALPEIQVTVANDPPPGRTSADVPAALPELLARTGARLVIWGPGGRDVAARLDLETFRTAVSDGIEAVRHGGADLILLDTTFVPAPSRMVLIEPYRDRLLEAAIANRVPLLRRHGLMRLWGQDGTLNLGARDPAEREAVVRRLFSCVAQGLAGAIAAAVR